MPAKTQKRIHMKIKQIFHEHSVKQAVKYLILFSFSNHCGRMTRKITSLISKRSISWRVRPADLTAAGIATAGPIPITAGSTPTTEKLLHIFFKKKKISSKV